MIFKKMFGSYCTLFLEQLAQDDPQLRILFLERLEPGSAFFLRQGKRTVEMRAQFAPKLWSECGHALYLHAGTQFAMQIDACLLPMALGSTLGNALHGRNFGKVEPAEET